MSVGPYCPHGYIPILIEHDSRDFHLPDAPVEELLESARELCADRGGLLRRLLEFGLWDTTHAFFRYFGGGECKHIIIVGALVVPDIEVASQPCKWAHSTEKPHKNLLRILGVEAEHARVSPIGEALGSTPGFRARPLQPFLTVLVVDGALVGVAQNLHI